MSLYTLSVEDTLSRIKVPDGLSVKTSNDVLMLSKLCNTSTEEISTRLANGNVAFVAFIYDEPAAFGWMATDVAKIGELNHEFYLPKGNRYLWNFRTFEKFRGIGIYPALLQYILQNNDETTTRFWIIHAPENIASLKGIRKVGFKYAGKLYVDIYNTTTIESNEVSLSLRDELEFMNITLSDQQPSSCWNCSSPFLKKRSSNCCCTESNVECVGKRDLSSVY